jgi:hypothetical protein
MKIKPFSFLVLTILFVFFAMTSCNYNTNNPASPDINSIRTEVYGTRCNDISTILWAGQTIDVGTVEIFGTQYQTIVFNINTTDDWKMYEIQIYIFPDPPLARPNPSHEKANLVNKISLDGTTSYLFAYSGNLINDLDAMTYIVVHVDVRKTSKSGKTQSETAFAGSINPVKKGSWFYYEPYEIVYCSGGGSD